MGKRLIESRQGRPLWQEIALKFKALKIQLNSLFNQSPFSAHMSGQNEESIDPRLVEVFEEISPSNFWAGLASARGAVIDVQV